MEATMVGKTLALKEKLVDELRNNVKDLERELEVARRENGALEKEVEVKNVELEFYRKSIDTSHRQHFENLQKISRLESDCLRLAKRRHVVPQSYHSLPHECLSNCLESLRATEEENKALKKLLMDLDCRSDGSSSVSWANALISELDHFKEEKMKNRESKVERDLEISLMDDFVEVEKLAMELSPSMEIIPVNEVTEDETSVEFDWLQEVMKAIAKEQRISKRSSSEIIQDVRIAVGCFDEGVDLNVIMKTKGIVEEIRALIEDDAALEKLIASCSGLMEKKINVSLFLEDVNEALRSIVSAAGNDFSESPPEKLNGMELLENAKSNDEKEASDEYKLAVTKSKVQEILQKVASLEMELEHKSQRCEELEASCLELQLVLEGLDEGKKMLALPVAEEEGANNRISMKRTSLREQIEAEDNGRAIIIRQRNGGFRASSYREMKRGQIAETRSPFLKFNARSGKGDGYVGTMVTTSGKKHGFSLWKKLLRRKRENGRSRIAS